MTKLKNQYEYLTVNLDNALSYLANNLKEHNSREHHLNKVKNLITQGADINTETTFSYTALILAIICKDDEFACHLINNGADITIIEPRHALPVFHLAATFGCLKVVKLLINKNVDINRLSHQNVTALMQASYTGEIEIVKLLLEHKAELNHMDINGWSALVGAANMSYIEIFKILLNDGASIEIFIHNPKLLNIIYDEKIENLILKEINKELDKSIEELILKEINRNKEIEVSKK